MTRLVPPAQYAESGDARFAAAKFNRFLFFGEHTDCLEVDSGWWTYQVGRILRFAAQSKFRSQSNSTHTRRGGR